MPGPFRPHEEKIPSYAEELARVPGVFERCSASLEEGDISFERAFFEAWTKGREGRYIRPILGIGASRFLELFRGALREAQWSLEELIAEYLSEHREAIDPIDRVASANDPQELMRVWEAATNGCLPSPPDIPVVEVIPFARRWVDRRANTAFEIKRKMAIAAQYVILESLDPLLGVERDLAHLAQTAEDRLFEPGQIARVTTRAFLAEDGCTCKYIVLGDGEPPDDVSWHTEVRRDYEVRCVKDADDLYIVHSIARPKLPSATILKLARQRKPYDRRGARHVLLAVRLDGASWMRARGEHIDRYLQVVQRRLFVEEFSVQPDNTPPNPTSSPLFRRKGTVMARLHRPSYYGVGRVRAAMELQVFDLEMDFADTNPKHPDNHQDYRRRHVHELADAWFPHLNGNGANI